MKHFLFVFGFLSFLFSPTAYAADNLVWTEVASGVWKSTIGHPDKVNLLNVADVKPKFDAINAMGTTTFPLDNADIRAFVKDGKTYLHFPLDKTEKIFGLGLNFQTVEQRGRIMRLHVDHYGGNDNGRTHAPVPFYVSSKGYGVLINAARYIDIYVGTAVRKDSKTPAEVRDRNTEEWSANPYSDNVEVLVPAEGVEIMVFGGATMLDVVRRYNLFNGGGCLPPKWGLGFWQRTPTLYTAADVNKDVAEFEKHNFPLSVIGLEPGWQTKAYPCTYEWDNRRFPDPAGFVHDLKQKDIQVNVWINPYISPVAGELGKIVEPYTASHTVWNGLVADYMMPEARKILTNHFEKNQVDVGVSGYKMDENDGYDSWLWPDVAEFPSGTPAEQMRQTYGMMMQKLTTDMYRQRNIRTYGLVRSSNAGASSFPYVIYNDYYSHPDFITALINSSFIGVLWTPEVRSSNTSEEWLRRMQTVCFSPLAMLNAWSDGTKPWSFPDVEKQVTDIARLRMQLIPYLYTSFADYAFYGTPPVRAMNLEEGYDTENTIVAGELSSTENPYATAMKKENKDQFMVGDYLLVAPLFTGQTERKVILPKGKWYNFYTGELAGEGEVISVTPGLDKIPVYVKDGGIIPMMPPVSKINAEKLPLEIRFYGQKPNSFQLYDDDGTTFDYEKGKFTRITLSVKKTKSGKLAGSVAVPKGATVWSFSSYTWKFMTKVD